MTIEIKQLLIKSSIADEEPEEKTDRDQLLAVKAEVLEECRRMIREMINDRGLR